MVPNGWSKKYLKDIISGSIKNGYSPLPAASRTGYWVMSLGALTDNGINSLEIKPVEFDQKVKQALLAKGDFLISRSNTPDKVGRSIRFKGEVENCSYPDLMMKFRVDPEKADPDFVEIKLTSSEIRQYYKSCAAGSSSTMVKINKSVVENTPLVLPSFLEQKKIAQILSTWDHAIATTERLLDLARQQKKALMQQLLTGKNRFTGFEGGWKKVKLSSIAEMRSGGTPKSSIDEYFGGGIPWVSIADMTRHGKWIETTEKTLTQLGLENSAAHIYPPNTILYAMYASIGECSIAKRELSSSQAILGIRPKPNLHYEYLYFYLVSLKDKIKLQGQQGTQANLNAGMVKDFPIHLPSIQEQQKIAQVLNAADQDIETLKSQLDALKQEKKALMQTLLTGKRRVSVDE